MTNNKSKTGAELKTAPVFLETHEKACQEKLDGYIDPQSGLYVLTSYYLKSRGYCCKNNCRHCPYKESEIIPCLNQALIK